MSFEQVFTMPAFEGLREARRYAEKNGGSDFQSTIEIIAKVGVDSDTFDFEGAALLEEIVPQDTDPSGTSFYQHCIYASILHYEPTWMKNITLGRRRFTSKLKKDQASLFRVAGLMASPPSMDVIDWWDELSAQVRFRRSAGNHERGRKAEELTIQFEQNYLQGIGISRPPEWIALEDNTAGYDVLSYKPSAYAPVNHLIEVKSTIASPLRFHVTRNEWKKAEDADDDAYEFYVWDLQKKPPQLHRLSASDIAPHIPTDNGSGKWEDVIVPVRP